jgi:hypothetical protein
MSIKARLVVLAASLGLLATGVYASAEAKTYHHRYAPMVQHYDFGRYAHKNKGPAYGRGFMNCIKSGHPADFCQEVGRDFR